MRGVVYAIIAQVQSSVLHVHLRMRTVLTGSLLSHDDCETSNILVCSLNILHVRKLDRHMP